MLAATITAALALALSTSARAATITVDSLADTGAPGICVLRDAITAANTMTAINGCVAGDGNDTVNFSVTGTIVLGSTLPQITDSRLTINGLASPGITIDGSGRVQVMQVGSGVSLNLNKLTIANGTALDNEGAGISIFGTRTLTVTNSTFSGNRAHFGGGAIANDRGTLIVTNSTFYRNAAGLGNGFGGGAIWNGGTLTVTNSTFSGNVSDFGGGIANAGGTVTVLNSTVSGNSTLTGGGIENDNGTVSVTNSTVSGNSADFGGGSIASSFGAIRLKSTILAASSGGSNCLTSSRGRISDAGYNISDDSSCGFNATGSHNNTDPMLDPRGLRDNGGPTQTIATLVGSPAIDAIPLAVCTDQASPANPIITDQRFFPRPDAGETNCDIGAYEFADAPFIPFASFHGSLTIDPDPGVFTLGSRFKLGSGGSIDPTMQPVAFSVGSYAIRLPAGSFTKYRSGYVYQKKVNGIFLCLYIRFTNTPGQYVLLANRNGGTLTATGSPVPVTLTIGDNSSSTQMNARFD